MQTPAAAPADQALLPLLLLLQGRSPGAAAPAAAAAGRTEGGGWCSLPRLHPSQGGSRWARTPGAVAAAAQAAGVQLPLLLWRQRGRRRHDGRRDATGLGAAGNVSIQSRVAAGGR